MGKRGPPKTPTAQLALRGSWRAADRAGEPQPVASAPPCPGTLNKSARSVWDQVTTQLAAMGTLAVSDGNALERYCRLFVEWQKVQAFIDKAGAAYTLYLRGKDGRHIVDDSGEKIIHCRIQHPEVGVRNKLNVDLLRLEQNFGLTPAGRAGITVAPTVAADPLLDMLQRRMGVN